MSLNTFHSRASASHTRVCSFRSASVSLHCPCRQIPHRLHSNFAVPASGVARQKWQLRDFKASLLKATSEHSDPGHWNYSPEWWGTQAEGWGHDAGSAVFRQQSSHGNGEVAVTAHPASLPRGAPESQKQQWRVLRFNDTRQSVSRVVIQPDSFAAEAQADCLAFSYLKTMASAAAAIIKQAGRLEACLTAAANPEGQKASDAAEQHNSSCRALCIGLGGGTLPNFLSYHFPGMLVDAVELDPVVIAAATQSMGLPHSRHNLRLHEGNAADFVLRLVAEVQQGQTPPLDLVFIDAFDGNDHVPSVFCSPDSLVLDALTAALHPSHGSVIMNLHGGGLPATRSLVALLSSVLPAAAKQSRRGYHSGTVQGKAVVQTTTAIRDKLFDPAELSQQGHAFTLSVAYQSNIAVVVSRAFKVISENALPETFAAAAQQAGLEAGYLFNAGSRAQQGMTFI